MFVWRNVLVGESVIKQWPENVSEHRTVSVIGKHTLRLVPHAKHKYNQHDTTHAQF